jgi:1-pyrroline-4-hydroxy-2-carboxylate deaminase
MKMQWRGVIPAITTPFHEDLSVDHEFFGRHCSWLIENGCTGIVALGSLGEGGTLTSAEKKQVLNTCVHAIGDRAPVIAGISSLSTADAVAQAKSAADAGCSGLMVLPPYVYLGDWREMKAHVSAVIAATGLSCMLYNNPVAYRVDFLPVHLNELLAEHENLHAIKESSADVRRIAALRSLVGNRLEILCGVDDLIVEAVGAGAAGWIAGLVNAFPKESVQLFEQAKRGGFEEAFELYKWFLPLLAWTWLRSSFNLSSWFRKRSGWIAAGCGPHGWSWGGVELAEAKTQLAQALGRK